MAGEFQLKYFYVSAASLLNKFVGVTEENIRNTFKTAQANRPALLFIDEIDALGAKRQQVGDADDTGGAARSFNSMTARLMECVDDSRKHPGLILIAATNFYDGLDRSLIREGRFDLHVRLDLPNEEERTRIFGAQLAKRPSRHFDLQPFAKRTPGWSAAKIGTLVDRAAFFAAEEGQPIGMKHILEGARTEYGKMERSLTPAEIRGWV